MKKPFKRGDWAARKDDEHRPDIAQVLEYEDQYGPPYLNLCLYAPDGRKIGRRSPAEGGPKGFEPCCPADAWRKIEEPCFPLKEGRFSGYYFDQLKFI